MNSVRLLLFTALWAWPLPSASPASSNLAFQQFSGTTPCDDASRAFVGGIASDIRCHTIAGQFTFSTNLNANRKPTYRLRAQYGLQGKTDPNQLEPGPALDASGEWEVEQHKGSLRTVYRLSAAATGKTVSLVQVSENLLHFLDSAKSLRVGNAGWSYTLNRKGVFSVTPFSEKVIEPAPAGPTNFWKEAAREGANIFGYFEGRSPCQEVAKLLNVPKGDACIKIKWQLILYQDPVTRAPTSYALGGLAWRNPPKRVSKGSN